MSEYQPEPVEKEPKLWGRTPVEWHGFLTTHNGEPAGHLATPGSTYGDDADQCAWWSVAGLCVYFHEVSDVGDVEEFANDVMSSVVNDSKQVFADVMAFTQHVPMEVMKNLTVGGSQ